MLEIACAIVIVAIIAGLLVNKYIDKNFELNTKPSLDEGTVAALEERINKFDQRINNTWDSISDVKQSLEAHKLAMGLKGNR